MTEEHKVELLQMTFEEVCAGVADKGLTAKDVLEANLFNLAATCADDAFVALAHQKMQAMQKLVSMLPPDQRLSNRIAVEEFMTELPMHISGIVSEMVKLNTIDPKRASDNFLIIKNMMKERHEAANLTKHMEDTVSMLRDSVETKH